MTTKVSRKLIGVLFAIAMFALSAAPALAGDGGGGQGGGGGGLSYESAGPVLFYVAGGFGFGGAGGEGGCGGVYAYNSITGEFLSGAGGSVCY